MATQVTTQVEANNDGASQRVAVTPPITPQGPDEDRTVPDRDRSLACGRCGLIASYVDVEPEQLEPVDHARMVVRWYQEKGLFGLRLTSHIAKLYPLICEESNVLAIGLNRVLAQMKAAGARKVRSKKNSNRRGYWIPKPKAAKVVAIDRRLQATSS